MNKEVYKHILKTYGRNVGQWVGFGAEIIRVLILRVYIVVLIAKVTVSIAAGDVVRAKQHLLYFFLAYIVGSVIGTLGELLSTNTENKQYNRTMMAFYEKLVGKDLAFYRDNQTGYLASIFRQYLDSLILMLRYIRGEALGVSISLFVPPLVLLWANRTIGLVAIVVVVIQFVYMIWASAKANKYRIMSHEAYRKVTGEVSDEITNIVALKSGGFTDKARSKVAAMGKVENRAYQLRRRMTTLLDLPRLIITAFGISLSVYLIISPTGGITPQSIGLIVLTVSYMFQIVRNVGALPELIISHDDIITKISPTLKYLSNDYEEIRDRVEPVELRIVRGAIRVKNVSFGYASHSGGAKILVFSDLNVEIAGGEQIGVVGLSGGEEHFC